MLGCLSYLDSSNLADLRDLFKKRRTRLGGPRPRPFRHILDAALVPIEIREAMRIKKPIVPAALSGPRQRLLFV